MGFILLEGGLSALLFLRDVLDYVHNHAPAGPTTREYDAELGWVNKPDAFDADAYGHGVYVRTNAMRARANRDFTASRPSNRVRVVCTGDSFTYGGRRQKSHLV